MRRTITCDDETPLGIGNAIAHLDYITDKLSILVASKRVKALSFLKLVPMRDYYKCHHHAKRLRVLLEARQKKYDLSDDTPIETVYLGLMLSILHKARDLKIIHLIPATKDL